MVIFVVGVSVFTSPTWDTTHPWYLLMWIEAYAYGASCLVLEEGRPLMERVEVSVRYSRTVRM